MLLPTRKPLRLPIKGHNNAAIFRAFISAVKSNKAKGRWDKGRSDALCDGPITAIATYTDKFARNADARIANRFDFHLSLSESISHARFDSRGLCMNAGNSWQRCVRFRDRIAPIRGMPLPPNPCE
jgi:hypothetical protein